MVITKFYSIHYIFVAIIRDSFLKALSHKQPNMETLRITLSTLVHYTDELLKDSRQLRPKTSKDVCTYRYKYLREFNHTFFLPLAHAQYCKISSSSTNFKWLALILK